jgi:ribonuclease HI
MILVYCDASYDNHKSNISVAVFNEYKQCIHEKVIPMDYVRNSFQAEFLAIKESLRIIRNLKIDKLRLFSDCNGVISAINYCSKNHKERVNEIRKLSSGIDVSFEWIPRSENKYADKLGRR